MFLKDFYIPLFTLSFPVFNVRKRESQGGIGLSKDRSIIYCHVEECMFSFVLGVLRNQKVEVNMLPPFSYF